MVLLGSHRPVMPIFRSWRIVRQTSNRPFLPGHLPERNRDTCHALFGTSGPPYIIYLTHRLRDKTQVRATFSWLFVIDGGFRLGLFLIAGLLFESKLQMAYVFSLIPMGLGLYIGNKVHLDMTQEEMLKVVGVLLMGSGAMLFVKVIF